MNNLVNFPEDDEFEVKCIKLLKVAFNNCKCGPEKKRNIKNLKYIASFKEKKQIKSLNSKD